MTPETAAEGNEALDKLADFPADVILTDLNMPGLDGFGFLQRLRDAGDMPPTIVLTAYGNIETAVKTVHELGAYWFLEKPIQPGTPGGADAPRRRACRSARGEAQSGAAAQL